LRKAEAEQATPSSPSKGKRGGVPRRAPSTPSLLEEGTASAPAAESSKKSNRAADRKSAVALASNEQKKAREAAERKAAEEAAAAKAAAAKAAAEQERRRVEEQAREAAAKAAAGIEAKKATVESIDFEGAWRAGGEYEVRYVAKEAGNFALHIWCDVEGDGERQRLPGSAFHLYVTPGPPSSSGSSITGSEKVTYIAGEQLQLCPQLRDAFGNPTAAAYRRKPALQQSSLATTIMHELLAQHGVGALKEPPKPPVPLSPSDDSHFFADEADQLSASPTKQHRSPADQLRLFQATSPQKRTAQLGAHRDKAAPAYELTAWLVSPKGTSSLPLIKDGNAVGLFTIDNYVVTLSGKYEVHVALNGAPITGSPVHLNVVPAEAHGRTSYVITPDHPAFVKLPYEITLHTLDRYGNRLTEGGTKIDGKVVDGGSAACAVIDHRDGTYSLDFTVNKVGSYNVEVRIAGAKVKGTEAAATASEAVEAEKLPAKKTKAVDKQNGSTKAPVVGKSISETVAEMMGADFDDVYAPVDGSTGDSKAVDAQAPKKRPAPGGPKRPKGAVAAVRAKPSQQGKSDPTPEATPAQPTAPAPAPAPPPGSQPSKTGPPLEVMDLTATI